MNQATFIPSKDVNHPETGLPIICAGLRYPLAEIQLLSIEYGFDNIEGTLWFSAK